MTSIPTRANIKPTFHGKTPGFSSVCFKTLLMRSKSKKFTLVLR